MYKNSNWSNEPEDTFGKYAFWCLLFIVILVAQPFLIIWALNQVFYLDIPYRFDSWLGVMILNFTWMFRGVSGIQKVQIVKD